MNGSAIESDVPVPASNEGDNYIELPIRAEDDDGAEQYGKFQPMNKGEYEHLDAPLDDSIGKPMYADVPRNSNSTKKKKQKKKDHYVGAPPKKAAAEESHYDQAPFMRNSSDNNDDDDAEKPKYDVVPPIE